MTLDVEFLASPSWDEHMPERLRWLRENDPVHWSEKDDLWLVSRFEDVSYVSKHQELRKEDFDRFHQWSDDMIAGGGNFDNPEIMARADGGPVVVPSALVRNCREMKVRFTPEV